MQLFSSNLSQSVRGAGSSFAPVVLFSYARSGSTLLSDVFNIDPNTTMLWYEALQGFHSYYSGLPEYSNELRVLWKIFYPVVFMRFL